MGSPYTLMIDAPYGDDFNRSVPVGMTVDADFVSRCLNHKLERKNQESFNNFGIQILRNIFNYKEGFFLHDPFFFINDTLLIQGVQVPGNACGVDLESIDAVLNGGFKISNVVNYLPHNVDSITQAYSIAVLFNKWVQCAEATMKIGDHYVDSDKGAK